MTDSIRLLSTTHPDWKTDQVQVTAAVFGEILRTTQQVRVLSAYQSDLYHDALWLQANLEPNMQFDFAWNDSGTDIGDIAQHSQRKYRRRFTLTESNGHYDLAIQDPNEPAELIDDSTFQFISAGLLTQSAPPRNIADHWSFNNQNK